MFLLGGGGKEKKKGGVGGRVQNCFGLALLGKKFSLNLCFSDSCLKRCKNFSYSKKKKYC